MSILKPKPRRTPTRLERWAWSPISAYRLGLTAGYVVLAFFGVQSFVAGIPAFIIAAPEGWTSVWAPIVTTGAVLGAIGSLSEHKRFERIETAGVWALSLTLATYAIVLLYLAYVQGDQNRAAVGAGLCYPAVTSVIRLLWLMTQFGRVAPTPASAEPPKHVDEGVDEHARV